MKALLALKALFFAPDAPEERRLPWWARYALPLVLFAVVRIATAQALDYREVHYDDDIGYVAGAIYVVEHGHVSTEHNLIYRQFPGLSLLMILPNLLLGNMVLSGYVVVIGSAIAAVCLVQFLFQDFRLTVIFTFFFPWWITTSVAIFSEPSVDVCFLLALWALRDARPWSPPYILALLAGGYAVVIRQPALFFLFPFIGLFAWLHRDGSFWRGVLALAVASVPLLAYLAWNQLTIHQLFPQARLQYEFMMSSVDQSLDPQHYSRRQLDWPFKSLIAGLTDPYEHLSKKAITLTTFSISCAAIACLVWKVRTKWRTNEGTLATAFLGSLLIYFTFHLCIGGLSSYRALDRYMSQLNIIIEWALFYRRPLRWPWIALLALLFTVYAFYTGPAYRPLGIFK